MSVLWELMSKPNMENKSKFGKLRRMKRKERWIRNTVEIVDSLGNILGKICMRMMRFILIKIIVNRNFIFIKISEYSDNFSFQKFKSSDNFYVFKNVRILKNFLSTKNFINLIIFPFKNLRILIIFPSSKISEFRKFSVYKNLRILKIFPSTKMSKF